MANKDGRKSRKELKRERIENAQVTEDGMSYDEIAEILGLKKKDVMRIEREALRKLQAPNETNKKFKKYLGGGLSGK